MRRSRSRSPRRRNEFHRRIEYNVVENESPVGESSQRRIETVVDNGESSNRRTEHVDTTQDSSNRTEEPPRTSFVYISGCYG